MRLVHGLGGPRGGASPPAAGPAGRRRYASFAVEPGEGLHWKLEAIEGDAGSERPVAWIDDAHDASCERWAAERPGATLLIATDPRVGLTDEHVATPLRWARAASA